MQFDEATELGNMAAQTDSDRALFRFIHSNAQCPFSLLGKLIDADNLYLFLGRAIRREASGVESRIVNMLGSGQLLSFYDEYISLSNEGTEDLVKDSFFYRLLLLMDKKTLLEQWEYFQALQNPDAYFWPEHASFKSKEETLETLQNIGAAPLKRETFKSLEKNYVLPQALLSLFRVSETYAQGATQLESWRTRELLLPRDFASDSFTCENLSLDEYAQAARVRCLGHTPAILEKLDFLIGALPTLQGSEQEAAIFAHTASQLKKLKDRKITSADSLFISKVAGLLAERRKFQRDRGIHYCITGFCGGLLSWLVRLVTGKGSDLLFMLTYIAALGGTVLGLAAYSEWFRALLMNTNWSEREGQEILNPAALFFLGFLLLSFLSFGRLMAFLPNLFPFLIGILPGSALGYVLDQIALSRNARRIAGACSARPAEAREEADE
jgi:hypothetical protein